jgi:hypothetical protein
MSMTGLKGTGGSASAMMTSMNRFRRQAVSTTLHTVEDNLEEGHYYVIQQGSLSITGDISLNDIGIYVDTQQTVTLGSGRIFKYASVNGYLFNDSASLLETIQTPPRVIAGLPNNEPVGWTDAPTAGSAQLWQISGQKSVYGQLKSDWILSKVNEDPNYIRYNTVPTPHPDTLVNTSTTATAGSAGDTALIAGGWVSAYNQQDYMATREDAGGGTYTPWTIRKINEESGEYTDRVFKLFDFNLDSDDNALQAPTTRDPSQEGWSDTPLEETDTKINYVSEARKFYDGSLKTSWSNPVPYTGKSIFNDIVASDLGNSFKYDNLGVVDPVQLTLRAELYKGTAPLWINSVPVITYTWKIVYNNGDEADTSPTTNSSDPFYLLGASGTPGNEDYFRANQRVVIKAAAVDGTAVVQCKQTLVMDEGENIEFIEDFQIVDITDGKDAKNLTISAEKDLIIYDTVNSVFNPSIVRVRAYQSNLLSPTYYWYRWNGSAWVNISTTPPTGYTFNGNLMSINLATAALFTANDSAQEARFAVSTHATNPDLADYNATFSDFQTIVKSSSNAVGQDGEPAIAALLDNEAHTLVLNSEDGEPQAGEIGSAGRAQTRLQLFEGSEKQIYGIGNDYTIAVSSDNPDVTFAFTATGDDAKIYVSAWGVNEIAAVCTITITFGSLSLTKKFSVATTRDAPGAILLDVVSNKGFEFTPQDRTNKTLTAVLYNTALAGNQQVTLPDSQYTFRWRVANVWSSPSTTNTRTITHSNVLVSTDITVEVYKDSVLLRSRAFRISDIGDGKIYRLYSTSSTTPAAPPSNIDIVEGNGTWVATSANAIWAVDGYQNAASPNTYTWGVPYRVKGEAGDQGGQGGFAHFMYKVADPGPPTLGAGGNTSTLAQMIAASWLSQRPNTGIIWQTQRFWTGAGVTFDGSGNPSTGPLAGSTWASPVRLSAKDGVSAPGTPGDAGWMPLYGLRTSSGVINLQIVDYFGGGGTKPTDYIGDVLSPTGPVEVGDGSAVNLSPLAVQMRFDNTTGYIQYRLGNSGGWTDLLRNPPPTVGQVLNQPNSWTSIVVGQIPVMSIAPIGALPYARRFVINGFVEMRRSSGTYTVGLFYLQVSVAGGSYFTIQRSRVKQNLDNRTLGDTIDGTWYFDVAANQAVTFRIIAAISEGNAEVQSSGIIYQGFPV